MSLRPKTLSARLFLLSSLVALIGVAIVAFAISTDYRKNTENRFQELLAANVYNMMGAIEVDANGALSGIPNLGDARYARFDSGWYWSVEKVDASDIRISSYSLADQQILVPPGIPLDGTFQRSFELEDNAGQKLMGLEAQVILGEGNDLYSFRITANKESVLSDVRNFSRRLAIILCTFAFSMVLATYFLVRFGLRPLSAATDSLAEIRAGRAEDIAGSFPDEIQPLIDETNALIKSNNVIIERARTQVGNLAHSLKTPLAVMNNELSGAKSGKLKLLAEQLSEMQRQVQVYLERARISARRSTALARTEVSPVLEKLTAVVGKLNPDIKLDADLRHANGMVFEGEEHDFQEIFGNLLENAAKFASSRVVVSAEPASQAVGAILIHVEDDGPGMTQTEISQAQKRGSRIDEGGRGWGLGLSIVRDIIDEYDGKIHLSKSDLGGLKAGVELPGRFE